MLRDIDSFVAHFEDLEVGERFTSPGRTLTEADVVAFAGLSGDYNLLHTDAEHAAGTAYGQRIAHGLLVLAVVSGLASRTALMRALEGSILGLLDLQCRWQKPTFLGDTLHVEIEIAGKRLTSKPGRGVVTLGRAAINQHGETVMESEWKLLVRSRATP